MRSLRSDARWFVCAGGMVAAVCLAVSLWNTWNVPFEGDEAATLAAIRMPWSQLTSFAWTQSDAAHFVFYLVAKVWAAVFGESELGMRSLSCVFLAAAVFTVAWVGRMLRGPLAGLAAAVVLMFLPRAVWGTLLARSYTMSMLLATLSVLVLLVALRRERPAWWLAWGAVTALSVWTYSYSLLLLPVLVVWAVARRLGKPVAAWWPWVVGSGVVVCSAPLLWLVFGQRAERGTWFAGNPVDWAGTFVAPFFVSVADAAAVAWVMLVGGLAVRAVAGRRRFPRRKAPRDRRQILSASLTGRPLVLSLCAVLVPLLVLRLVDGLWLPVFSANYLPYCAPFLALSLVLVLARMRDRPVAVVALIAVCALAVPWIVNNKTWGNTHRSIGWGQTRDLITGEARPGDCLVTSQAGPKVRNPSRGVLVYRQAYSRLRDLSLVATSVQVGGFYDSRRGVEQALAGQVCARLWFITPADQTVDGPLNDAGKTLRGQERAAIRAHGYHMRQSQPLPGTLVELYEGTRQ